MEVSGSSPVAMAEKEPSESQRLYKHQVARIQASGVSQSEKALLIKNLTHEVMGSIMRTNPADYPQFQAKVKGYDFLSEKIFTSQYLLRQIAAMGSLSLNGVNALSSMPLFLTKEESLNRAKAFLGNEMPLQSRLLSPSEFLFDVRDCLSTQENRRLNELLDPYVVKDPRSPLNDEILSCFSDMKIDFRGASVVKIREAIEESTKPSKKDVEITARAIVAELVSNDIDYVFPEFSDENYEEELRDIINADDFPRDEIENLTFSKTCVKVVPDILGAFENLDELHFTNCKKLNMPPNVRENQHLVNLYVTGCENLFKSPDISKNLSLEKFSLVGCVNITKVDVTKNTQLKYLDLSKTSIDRLNLQDKPALKELDLSHCKKLSKSPLIENCLALEKLDLSDCLIIRAPDVRKNPNLTDLSLKNCPIKRAPDVRENLKLIALELRSCKEIEGSPDLKNNKNLEYLDLSFCDELSVTPDVSQNKKIAYIMLRECPKLTETPVITGLNELETLDISHCPNITSVPDTSGLTETPGIIMTGCTGITGATPEKRGREEATPEASAPPRKRERVGDSDSD